MKTSWVSGLEPDAKKQMEDYFKSSPILRERLAYILENKAKNIRSVNLAVKQFESPSWAYKQADRNGYERAIAEIIELISD